MSHTTLTALRLSLIHQSHRTDYARFVSLFLFADDAQPIFLVQGYRQVSERLVRDTAAELPVECVGRGLPERVTIDIVDRFS